MADMRKMDADLMRAPGLEPTADQRGYIAELLFDLVMRDRAARRRTLRDGDLLPVVR